MLTDRSDLDAFLNYGKDQCEMIAKHYASDNIDASTLYDDYVTIRMYLVTRPEGEPFNASISVDVHGLVYRADYINIHELSMAWGPFRRVTRFTFSRESSVLTSMTGQFAFTDNFQTYHDDVQ